jgi:hypothetical protein
MIALSQPSLVTADPGGPLHHLSFSHFFFLFSSSSFVYDVNARHTVRALPFSMGLGNPTIVTSLHCIHRSISTLRSNTCNSRPTTPPFLFMWYIHDFLYPPFFDLHRWYLVSTFLTMKNPIFDCN